MLEAFARGVPVIGTTDPGAEELLRDGRGTVVPDGDAPALAAAITAFAADPGAARDRARLAREYVRELHSWPAVADGWDRFLSRSSIGRRADVRDRGVGRRVGADERRCGGCARASAHRGPDDEGTCSRPARSALGIRRLSIIDLVGRPPADRDETSDSGSPATARSTTSASCAPGSSARGHRSAPAATPKCIAHLYEEHGERLPRAAARHVRLRAVGRAPRGG